MKRFCVSLGFLGCKITLFLMCVSVFKAEILTVLNPYEMNVKKSQLQVVVSLDKDKLGLKDGTNYTIEIKNVGDSHFFIYKDIGWGAGSSLTYSIMDKKGNYIFNGLLRDAHDYPPYSAEDFVKLEKDESFTIESWLDVYSEGIKKPGKYKLFVFYHSPVFRKYAPSNLKIWASEDGTVESNTVNFTVEKSE